MDKIVMLRMNIDIYPPYRREESASLSTIATGYSRILYKGKHYYAKDAGAYWLVQPGYKNDFNVVVPKDLLKRETPGLTYDVADVVS